MRKNRPKSEEIENIFSIFFFLFLFFGFSVTIFFFFFFFLLLLVSNPSSSSGGFGTLLLLFFSFLFFLLVGFGPAASLPFPFYLCVVQVKYVTICLKFYLWVSVLLLFFSSLNSMSFVLHFLFVLLLPTH